MEKKRIICHKKVSLVMMLLLVFMPNVTFANTSTPTPAKVQTTQTYNRYVTITAKGYPSVHKVGGKQKFVNNVVYQRTFVTRQQVTDNKKQKHVSLYDQKGKFYGFINQQAVKVASGAEGVKLPESQQVMVNVKGYDLFKNFKWQVKQKNNSVLKKVYVAKGRYQHTNGSVYYSLFDNKNNWMGYINANGVKKIVPPKKIVIPAKVVTPVKSNKVLPVAATSSYNVTKELREAEQLYLKKLAALRKTAKVRATPAHATLNKAAATRSQDLMKRFDHRRPNGQAWDSVIDKQFAKGYYGFGENILIATESRDRSAEYLANRFYTLWRNSSGHYENMIYGDYAVTGVAFAVKVTSSGYEFYATNIFGAK